MIENLSTLLNDIQTVQLCGSYLYSKGAYSLNIVSSIDCQYNSPQEPVADYFTAVLCHNVHSEVPYLESLPAAYVVAAKHSLQSALCTRVLNVSHNFINRHIAAEIAIILSFTNRLEAFHASGNNLLNENIIKIAKAAHCISNLTVFHINDNNISEEAADDIATVLSDSTNLQELFLHNNNFKAMGIIKIAKAL